MSRTLQLWDLGRQPYEPVLELQEQLASERVAEREGDSLLLVEHEPVYTLGRRGDEAHILMGPAERERLGIAVVKTARGGDVTYHGPGQLVGYPILHLGGQGGAVWYVSRLEEVLIDALKAFGLQAGTDPINRGVWIGKKKIAAIGVRIARQVTTHGFALNVAPDMRHYAGIVACGIREREVTSLEQLGVRAEMGDVKRAIIDSFCAVFRYGAVVPRAANDLAAVGKGKGT